MWKDNMLELTVSKAAYVYTKWIYRDHLLVNALSANHTKWSNTLKQLSEFDRFVGLRLEGLRFNSKT